MAASRWGWWMAVVGVVLGGCNCDPKSEPDASTPEALSWPAGARLDVTATTETSATLQWPAAQGPVTSYQLRWLSETRDTSTSNFTLEGLAPHRHLAVAVVALDQEGRETPPLRAEVAPARPLAVTDGDISTDFCGASSFLVLGEAIPCETMSVLTGHVRTRDGVGVPGLRVSVLHHPEWGEATSQSDGLYALAVPAGRHTVQLQSEAFLPLQRATTALLHQLTVVPDTVVLRRDEKATTVSTVTGGFHTATTQQDDDGTRTTSVFIPAGTEAWLKLADGGTQPTTSLTLRATEATVGTTGPESMPATLPPATAYTFAADVSADEALAAGATGVGFGSAVAMYADNFLHFPVGTAIPLGLYDETAGRWESGTHATVLRVAEGGVDVTGDGVADTDFSLLPGEKEALAAHFAAGTEVVRSTTTHFSTFDTNSCWMCVGSCVPAGSASAGDVQQCTKCTGSLLRVENRTLSEYAPVAGTGLTLGWHSNRFNARKSGVDFSLGALDDGGTPEDARGSYFRLDVAGRRFVQENLDAGTAVTTRLEWDGKDAFGRAVKGPVPATTSVGYGFGAVYVGGAAGTIVLARPTFGVWPPPGALAVASSRELAFILRHTSHLLGDWVPRENLGNFTLDVVHGYSEDGTLHLGTGDEVRAAEGGAMLRFFAGGGTDTSEDAGFDSVNVSVAPVLAEGPAGVFFVEGEARIRLLQLDGGVRTVAGDVNRGFAGDGRPATEGRFNYARVLETDSEGNLFVGDVENHRIRRVDAKTGVLTTVVGNGLQGFSPDGTLATEAKLDGLSDILFGHDGHLYFFASDDAYGATLRRVEADGTLRTVAGGSTASRPPWEATHPRDISFRSGPHWLGQDDEGRLYVAGYDSGEGTSDYVLRRIDGDGRVHLLAGAGTSAEADEVVARKTCLAGLTGLAVAPDGTAYVGEAGTTGCGRRGPGVRQVSTGGDFSLFLGGVRAATEGFKPPDGAAAATQLNALGDVVLRRDGRLLVVHRGPTTTVHEVRLPMAGATRVVPSRDGNEVYAFDARGRHLRTLSARTGVTLWEFTWGPHGLEALKDVDGDVTTVEREADGRVRALRAQDGQRTVLTLDDAGRVTKVTDSEGRFVEARYRPGTDLLEEWKDENGHPTTFEWDEAGNLKSETNARQATRRLDVVTDGVGLTSPEGKQTRYLKSLGGGRTALTTAWPDGTQATRAYGAGVQRFYARDGTFTQVELQAAAASRFGVAAEVPGQVVVTTPLGVTASLTSTRTTTTAPGDVFSVTEEVEETRVNGRLWRSRYDGAGKTYTATTPEGRMVVATLDEKTRPLTLTWPGTTLLPVTYVWDSRGRLASVTQGTRSVTYAYGPQGWLASAHNARNEETAFVTDSTGRVRTVTQADRKEASLAHDAVGNLTSVTPADRQAHGFTYSAVDEVTAYTPPAVPGVVAETTTYNLDGQVTKAGHSDGSETVVGRDDSGRTKQVTTPWWTNEVTYVGTTGQVQSVTRGTQKLAWLYDGFLMTEEKATGVAPATVQWSYDSDFRVASQAVGGVAVAYGYDGDSLLTQAGAATLAREAGTGQLSSLSVGAMTAAFTHNGYGELSTVSVAGLYTEGLQYDDAGRLVVVEETVEGTPTQWVYGYDAMGRLTSASKSGAAASTWSYDGNGNRLTEDGVASTYDAQDRLLTRGATTYGWDALGGRRSKTEGAAVTQYVHDGLGALQSVTLPGGAVISYDYDGRQRRVAKRRNGVVEKRWVYDGQYRVVAEVDASGAVTSRFVYGSQSHSPDYFVRGGVTYAYVKSHLGSVRLVVDAATRAVVQRLDYDAWGQVVADSSPGFQPFGFAGGVYDVDTRLTHFGFRDYDAQAGVWTSKDPIRLSGGLGVYGYSAGDPVGKRDRSGLWVDAVFDPNLRLLTLVNPQTGDSISAFAWSGLSTDEMAPNEGPIPEGEYSIALKYTAYNDYFSLDPLDDSPGDDRDSRTGRGNFRLHVPGASLGCIAIGKSGAKGVRPEGDLSVWLAVRGFLWASWSGDWMLLNGTPRPVYGRLTVLPRKIPSR